MSQRAKTQGAIALSLLQPFPLERSILLFFYCSMSMHEHLHNLTEARHARSRHPWRIGWNKPHPTLISIKACGPTLIHDRFSR